MNYLLDQTVEMGVPSGCTEITFVGEPNGIGIRKLLPY